MDSSTVIQYIRDLQTNNDSIIKNASDNLIEFTKMPDFIPILIDLLSNDDDYIQKEACTLLNRTINLNRSDLDPENAKSLLLKIIPIFLSANIDLTCLIFQAINSLSSIFDSNEFFLEIINSLHQTNDKLHQMFLCLIPSVNLTPISSLAIELVREFIITEDFRVFYLVLMLILALVAYSNIQSDEIYEINKILQESLLYYIKNNKENYVNQICWIMSQAFNCMASLLNIDEIFNELLEELQKSTSNQIKASILCIIYILISENLDTEFEQNEVEDIMTLIIQEMITMYDPEQTYLDQHIVGLNNPLIPLLQKLPDNIKNIWILEKIKALVDQNDESCYIVAVCILQSIVEGQLNIFDETQLENIYSMMLLLLSEGNTNIRMAVLDFYSTLFGDIIFSVETFPFEDTISVLFELYQSGEFSDALNKIYGVILRMKSTDAIFDDLFNTIKGFINEEQSVNAQSDLIMILSASFRNAPEILKNQSETIYSFLQENLIFDGSVDMDILNSFLACLSNCVSCYPNFYVEHQDFVHNIIEYAIQSKNIHFINHIDSIIHTISQQSTVFVTQYAEQILLSTIEFLKIAAEMLQPVHYSFCLRLISYDLTMNIELLKDDTIANIIIDVIKNSVNFSLQTEQDLVTYTVDLIFISLNGLSENEQICNTILEILNPYIIYAMKTISDSKSALILKQIQDKVGIRAFGNNDIAIIQNILDYIIKLTAKPFFFIEQSQLADLTYISLFLIYKSPNVDNMVQFAQSNIEKFLILCQNNGVFSYANLCITFFISQQFLSENNINDIIMLCNEKINELNLNFCEILIIIAKVYPTLIPLFFERVCTTFISLLQSEEKNPFFEYLISLLCVIFCKSEGDPFPEEIHRSILSFLPLKKNFSNNDSAIRYLIALESMLPENLTEIYTKCIAEHLCHPFADFPRLCYPNDSVNRLGIIFINLVDADNFEASIKYLMNNNQEKTEILINTLYCIYNAIK